MRTEQLAQLRAKAQTKPRRILVVEDEEDIRTLLCELLGSSLENVIVEGRGDGPSALKAIAANAPDLVITDYKMPGMNGLDFLAHVRLQLPNVPAILITAFPELDLAVRAINEARVQSFLQKPVDPAQVLRVVGGILTAFSAARSETPGSIRSVETQRLQRFG
ncbi:MAG TPA: response regulator [Candidatus Thermoplasmatota archaeon]|nr:response regulator [Candidatus Thermoplasmatota archaeon]